MPSKEKEKDPQQSFLVYTAEGHVRGRQNHDFEGHPYVSFLGIPYASAPEKERRFSDPFPIEPWLDVFDATKEGPACPSRHLITDDIIGAENNCLNLNVYTKRLPTDGPLVLRPVMVFIYGYAFLQGSNSRDIYGPDYLITEDIVLVVINYRMGAFGFLAFKDPNLEVRGNAGMKDIVYALRWVRRNIALFNGDPNNVTVFGQDAGATAVHLLNLSPMARGLYHKAIAQSGSPLNFWAMCQATHNAVHLARLLGMDTDVVLETPEYQLLQQLRELSAKEIVRAQELSGGVTYFAPIVEKKAHHHPKQEVFLTDTPINLLRSGEFNKVPLIAGYTSREGLLFEYLRQVEEDNTKEMQEELPMEMGLFPMTELAERVAQMVTDYYCAGADPYSSACTNYMTTLRSDLHFIHPIFRTILHYRNNRTSHAPIFFYRFHLETSLNYHRMLCTAKCLSLFKCCARKTLHYKCMRPCCARILRSLPKRVVTPGASHGDDLCYLFKQFHSLKYKKGSAEDLGIRRMCRMWANFARMGDPTPKDDWLVNAVWEPVMGDGPIFTVFDIGPVMDTALNPDYFRINFWNRIIVEECKRNL